MPEPQGPAPQPTKGTTYSGPTLTWYAATTEAPPPGVPARAVALGTRQ